jgi:hypothetical protein
VLPVLVSREKLQRTTGSFGSPIKHIANGFIGRPSTGRHVIGYEVQTVWRPWIGSARNTVKRSRSVCGHAEGGLIAFYAAAIDLRIESVLVSGYFDSRQKVWAEPIYRNVWVAHRVWRC